MTYYQKFNEIYIIESEDKFDSKIQEEILYVTVLSPSGFINQQYEARCFIN